MSETSERIDIGMPQAPQTETAEDYITAQAKRSKRWIVAAILTALTFPAGPIMLFWDEAYWFEGLFDYHWAAGVAGFVVVFACIAAPVWAGVRITLEWQALKRYREYHLEQEAFLAGDSRCPLDAHMPK